MTLNNNNYIKQTFWDQKVFQINTFEIPVESEETLSSKINQIKENPEPGHYTIKVNPLWNTKILADSGFYYCDTLIQPYCDPQSFIFHHHPQVSISLKNSLEELLTICNGAFAYGRFHRDFNIDQQKADLRYNSWLSQLFQEQKVWGLIYDQELVGFWAFSEQNIVLHALKSEYRGKGMAKYFWSNACQEMFKSGYQEIISSISASNLAILNLYRSLGFKFKNAQNVYHLLIN